MDKSDISFFVPEVWS